MVKNTVGGVPSLSFKTTRSQATRVQSEKDRLVDNRAERQAPGKCRLSGGRTALPTRAQSTCTSTDRLSCDQHLADINLKWVTD